jgi:uncharacterized protein YjbI with pentapeptide repeats
MLHFPNATCPLLILVGQILMTKMNDADLLGASIVRADFSEADLERARFNHVNSRRSQFGHARLNLRCSTT